MSNFVSRRSGTQTTPTPDEPNPIIMDPFTNPFLFPFLPSLIPTSISGSHQHHQSMNNCVDIFETVEFRQNPDNGVENVIMELAGLFATAVPDVDELWTNATTNASVDEVIPETMPVEFTEMSQSTLSSVIAYCVLFLIAFVGNVTVFFKVLKEYRRSRGRIPLLILHLCLADLIVTGCLIPIEVTWRITIQWYGGTALCKACQFLRAFGLYLSSMVLICVSMDRFWAILYPLKVIEGRRRVKVMLWAAWGAALLFSIPQVIFFSVVSHPKFPTFRQCVTSSFLLDPEDAKLYSIFSVSAMYFAPLSVIIFTYSRILFEMIRKSRATTHHRGSSLTIVTPHKRAYSERGRRVCRKESWRRLRLSFRQAPLTSSSELTSSGGECDVDDRKGQRDDNLVDGKAQLILRMSGNAVLNISRAKNRTLKMTILILLTFLICWTPYVVMTLWYMFDWEGAKRVDPKIQDGLFLMAVANSCLNPLVYGTFSRNSNSCRIPKLFVANRPNRAPTLI